MSKNQLNKTLETKCGEIFRCNSTEFIIYCNICNRKFFEFENFWLHTQKDHLDDNAHTNESLNADCNQFLEVSVKNEAVSDTEDISCNNSKQSDEIPIDKANHDYSNGSEEAATLLRVREMKENYMRNKEFESNNKEDCDHNYYETSQMDFNSHRGVHDFATKRDIQDVMLKLDTFNIAFEQLFQEIKLIKNIDRHPKILTSTISTMEYLQDDFPATNTLRRTAVLPNSPFVDKEHFLNFESSIQSSEELFSNLILELKDKVSGNSSKFIKNCWRLVMKDAVAKEFCWQGTASKISLRSLSTTLAIKKAYMEKFMDHTEFEFEKITIMHFQQAKNRYDKKIKYSCNQKNLFVEFTENDS